MITTTIQLTKSEINILLFYIQVNMAGQNVYSSKSDVFSYCSLFRLYSKVLKKSIRAAKIQSIDFEPDEMLAFQELTKIVRENIYNPVINKIILGMPVEIIKIIENDGTNTD